MSGLRIMWQSNAPWAPTGYGTQANSLIPRLMEMPEVEDIGIFAYYGIMGAKTRQRVGVGRVGSKTVTKKYELDCYPLRSDMWGNDVIHDHAADFDANVVISLMDIWVLADDYGNRGYRWVPYMPIDMDPPPPPVISKMRNAYLPIVYSKFAKRWCDDLGLETVYIPHGVETQVYKPYSQAVRQDAKEIVLGMDKDTFAIGCVAANKGYPMRKGLGELMEAFSIFHKRHTDARLYLHSLLTSEYGGPDLQDMANAYGIRQYVKFVDPYKLHIGIDIDTMAAIYNAMDVFVLPSRGEGFGIPIIEAQACGVPVIVTDSTSMTELCGSGWLIAPGSRDYTSLASWQQVADVGRLVDCMEEAYKADRKTMGKAARNFAMSYDWDVLAAEGWQPLIKRLHSEVVPRTYVR